MEFLLVLLICWLLLLLLLTDTRVLICIWWCFATFLARKFGVEASRFIQKQARKAKKYDSSALLCRSLYSYGSQCNYPKGHSFEFSQFYSQSMFVKKSLKRTSNIIFNMDETNNVFFQFFIMAPQPTNRYVYMAPVIITVCKH